MMNILLTPKQKQVLKQIRQTKARAFGPHAFYPDLSNNEALIRFQTDVEAMKSLAELGYIGIGQLHKESRTGYRYIDAVLINRIVVDGKLPEDKCCPKCNRKYPDSDMAFCLEDGSPLAYDLIATQPDTLEMTSNKMSDEITTLEIPQNELPIEQIELTYISSKEKSASLTDTLHIPIPNIYGLHYKEAREKLINAGWQPGLTHWSDFEEGSREYNIWQEFVELESASGTGYGFCRFLYSDVYRNKLVIITAGEESPEGLFEGIVTKYILENKDIV